MATQVPAGYNPEASLLQGGTAPIVPVQGGGGGDFHGGGSPPPDYNPSASLLQGGTGVIEPIKGGGKAGVTFATDLESERTYSPNAPPKNVVRASRAYTLEIYGIKTEASNLSLDTDLNARQRRLMSYVNAEKQTRLVTMMSALGEDGEFGYAGYPKYGDCKPSLPINYFTTMARKVTFLDDKPHILWLIPNIQGNKEVFETILEKIVDKGMLPGKEHLLIFTGGFYANTPNETSVFLFDEILKLKQKNPGQVFVVSTPNAILLRNGCYILENTYAMKSTLAKQEGKAKDVPTFFEPDVLVLPHEKIIIRSTDMPISAESRVSVGKLIAKSIRSKSYLIKPEPGRKAEPSPFAGYTTIISNFEPAETRTWPPRSQQTIRCPKGSDCQLFEVGFPLSLMGDSPFLNLLETKLYLFHITLEKVPYLTGPKEEEEAGAEDEEAPEEEEEEEEEEIEVEEVNEEPIQITRPVLPKGPFQEDPNAKHTDQLVKVEVEGFTFLLRMGTQPIQLDWMNSRFTKDEANFLNALQLTPKLLEKVFGVGYQWRIRNFLTSLTVSNCFKEAALLLKSECDDARRFLRKIGFEMQKACLADVSKQWAEAKEHEVAVIEPEPEPETETETEPELLGTSVFLENIKNGLNGLTLPRPTDPSLRSIVTGMNALSLGPPRRTDTALVAIVSELNGLNLDDIGATAPTLRQQPTNILINV